MEFGELGTNQSVTELRNLSQFLWGEPKELQYPFLGGISTWVREKKPAPATQNLRNSPKNVTSEGLFVWLMQPSKAETTAETLICPRASSSSSSLPSQQSQHSQTSSDGNNPQGWDVHREFFFFFFPSPLSYNFFPHPKALLRTGLGSCRFCAPFTGNFGLWLFN